MKLSKVTIFSPEGIKCFTKGEDIFVTDEINIQKTRIGCVSKIENKKGTLSVSYSNEGKDIGTLVFSRLPYIGEV